MRPGGWAECGGMYKKRFILFLKSFCGNDSLLVNRNCEIKKVNGFCWMHKCPIKFTCVIHVFLEVNPSGRVFWGIYPDAKYIVNLSFIKKKVSFVFS